MTAPENVRSANHAATTPDSIPPHDNYYASLIDWANPDDPIRKLASPLSGGLGDLNRWEAQGLSRQEIMPGLQHVYGTNATLNLTEDGIAGLEELKRSLGYIAEHPEINQVLLTGVDALALDEKSLAFVVSELRAIDHVRIIRLASQLPVREPSRIYAHEALLSVIRTHSSPEKRIYLTIHINHPREITEEAKRALESLQQAGAILVNRTHVLRGINDEAAVLAELLDRLVWSGVAPYYFFVQAPTESNAEFVLPLARAYQLIEEAKALASGLGKRVRLSMSHASGMVEILAIEQTKAYLKHYPTNNGQQGRFLMVDCPPDALWIDELEQSAAEAAPAAEEPWVKRVPDLEIEIDLTDRKSVV